VVPVADDRLAEGRLRSLLLSRGGLRVAVDPVITVEPDLPADFSDNPDLSFNSLFFRCKITSCSTHYDS
jgi:hypothetical protein